MLYRSTDRLCRCGAPVQYLSHSASLHSLEKYAPPNAGTKHLLRCRRNGRVGVSSFISRCQAGVFELWVPGGAATCGCEVEDRPQGVDVRGSARVLAGVGHLTAHLSAPEVADCAIDASEDVEAGNVTIVGADVGAGVVAFGVGVDL